MCIIHSSPKIRLNLLLSLQVCARGKPESEKHCSKNIIYNKQRIMGKRQQPQQSSKAKAGNDGGGGAGSGGATSIDALDDELLLLVRALLHVCLVCKHAPFQAHTKPRTPNNNNNNNPNKKRSSSAPPSPRARSSRAPRGASAASPSTRAGRTWSTANR
jgi:hypothetical protein